jgi:hypothetical protein
VHPGYRRVSRTLMRAWPRLQWFQRLPPDPRAEATSACLGPAQPNSALERLHQSPAVSLFACCQKQISSPRGFGRAMSSNSTSVDRGYVQDGTSGFHRPSLAPYNTRNLPPKADPSPCGPFQGGPPTGGMPAYHDRMSPRWHLRALVQGLLLPDPDKRLVSLRNLFRW